MELIYKIKNLYKMKKIIKVASVAVVAAVAGIGVYTSQKTEVTSDIVLANVEALARGESGDECYGCDTSFFEYCKLFDDWGGCIGRNRILWT